MVIFHLFLHVAVPALVAGVFFRSRFRMAFLMMLATMLVDVDHLLASPVYDPGRCSIGFHPLHKLLPICFYGLLTLFPKARLIGLGLLIHMGLDAADCLVMDGAL